MGIHEDGQKVQKGKTGLSRVSDFEHILEQVGEGRGEDKKRPLVGWTCTYLPLEILEAGGLGAYRVLPEPSSEKADAYLDPNFCSLIKALLGSAVEGKYSFLSGIIVVNTCDGMRRLYDAWQFYCPPGFGYLLDLPRVIRNSSLTWFKQSLEELITHIEEHFQVNITGERLTTALEQANATRGLLNRLFSLQGKGDPPLGYGDILDIIVQRWRQPREVFNRALELFITRLESLERIPPKGPNIMVVGSPLDGSPLVRLVEDLGGKVVDSDLCTGGRFVEEIPLSPDPLTALARGYLEKTPCARMNDTEARISRLKGKLKNSSAQGVIYSSLKFCDPYLYEWPALHETLRQMDIPSLFIEWDYTGRISGGVRTRVQAFLEMLEKYAG